MIQVELKDRLAEELLFGRLAKGGTVRVDLAADEPPRLTFEIVSAG